MNPKSLIAFVFAGAMLISLSGCQQYVETVADLKKSLTAYQQSSTNELAEYKKSLANMQDLFGQEIVTLNKKLADLQIKIAALDPPKPPFQFVVLDPKLLKAYQRLDANLGTFLISIESVVADKNDLKVTLNIGNPSTMAFHGFKLNTTWGAGLHKEFSLAEVLKPGTWNKVSVTRPNQKLKDLERLELVLVTDRVHLK
jgi:hypothetical protein